MKLIWSNAKKFNRPRSDIYKKADLLGKMWSQTFARIRNDPLVTKLWGRKSRRSKPKKSPRASRSQKIWESDMKPPSPAENLASSQLVSMAHSKPRASYKAF